MYSIVAGDVDKASLCRTQLRELIGREHIVDLNLFSFWNCQRTSVNKQLSTNKCQQTIVNEQVSTNNCQRTILNKHTQNTKPGDLLLGTWRVLGNMTWGKTVWERLV